MTSRRHLQEKVAIGICILAGGLSRRMGRDKAAIRLGGSTLLQRVRKTADQLDLPVRVIRRDLVPRCGPLGGIYTGLITSRAAAELFLACDMPFVQSESLRQLIDQFNKTGRPVFTRIKGVAGFPLLIPTREAATVFHRIEAKELSIQSLAVALDGVFVTVRGRVAEEFRNLNAPTDLNGVMQKYAKSRHSTRFKIDFHRPHR
jgi:molybdopterin-guanine dinucleotide biosynthesis protein A